MLTTFIFHQFMNENFNSVSHQTILEQIGHFTRYSDKGMKNQGLQYTWACLKRIMSFVKQDSAVSEVKQARCAIGELLSHAGGNWKDCRGVFGWGDNMAGSICNNILTLAAIGDYQTWSLVMMWQLRWERFHSKVYCLGGKLAAAALLP